MTNSREKGKRFERKVAGIIRSHGWEARRGQQYCGTAGDADVVGLPKLHIECKHCEHMRLDDWYAQSVHDAREGEVPVVVHHRNNGRVYITLDFNDFLEIGREWLNG